MISDPLLFAFPEHIEDGDYVIASYYLEADAETDVLSKAAAFAIGQTVGTWVPVPGLTQELKEKHMGKVVAIYDLPPRELRPPVPDVPRRFIVQVAFPTINFGAQFPMLWTTLLGNDASTSAQVKLVDLRLSRGFVSGFQGPKFGVAGIRKMLGVPQRPLLLNIIKPNTGFPPQVGAQIFYEAALGGVDLIKDDELMGNTRFNPVADRVAQYAAAAKRAYEETGHLTRYIVNITDRPERMVENARRAAEAGAGAVMVSFVAAGLGMLQAIAEDTEVTIPVVGHYAGAGALFEPTTSGISSPLLLGKLPRLGGADVVCFNSPYGNYPLLREKYLRTAQFLRMPLYHLKPVLPAVGGGAHPGMVQRIVDDLGYDVILGVGGAIQGHPLGATAGGRAMRQAIDAVVAGRSVEEAAQESPELRAALAAWRSR